jgi:aquaporin Z
MRLPMVGGTLVCMPASRMLHIAAAEAVGTFVLVVGGPGSAVLATGAFSAGVNIGVLGVALAFGLSLLAMAYAIGNISGCHINPAVTIGLWVGRKLPGRLVPIYIVAQVVGAILGAGTIAAIATGGPLGFHPTPANFAVNGWGSLSPAGFDFTAMAATEMMMTALLVFVVLSTTHRKFSPAAGGLAVGLTLTLIHLVSIPVDNTSVNPARSIGMAVFAGGKALDQLWAFLVFPIVGAAIGVLGWKLVDDGGGVDEAADAGATRVVDIADPAVQAGEARAR